MAVIAVGVWLNATGNLRPQQATAQVTPLQVDVVAVNGRSINPLTKGLPVQVEGSSVYMPVDVAYIAGEKISSLEAKGLGNLSGISPRLPVIVPR